MDIMAIISWLFLGIDAVYNWFVTIFVSVDAMELLISLFFIFTTYRFLLSPLLKGGSAGRSDKARKTKTNNTEDV